MLLQLFSIDKNQRTISLPLLESTWKLYRSSYQLVCRFCSLFKWLFCTYQIWADPCRNGCRSRVLCWIFWFCSACHRIVCRPWPCIHRLLQCRCSLRFQLHLTGSFFAFLTRCHIHLPQFNVCFPARRKFLNQLFELFNCFGMSHGLLIQKQFNKGQLTEVIVLLLDCDRQFWRFHLRYERKIAPETFCVHEESKL